MSFTRILQPFERRSRFVVHRDLPYDIYIGRPTRWGNKFSHKSETLAEFRVTTREEAVYSHAKWLMTQPDLLADVHTLKGLVLGCWCDKHRAPFDPAKHLCHGHVYAWLANGEEFFR